MLQNKIKIYGMESSTENPSRHSTSGFLNFFYYIRTNKLLCCFILPGLIIGVVGLYMGLIFLQTFHHGASFDLGYGLLAVLLTFVGSFLAFIGVLLNTIVGLIRYRASKL
jgi:hypothetical protein